MRSKKTSIAEDVVEELRPISRFGGDFKQSEWDRALNALMDDMRTTKIYRFSAQAEGVEWVFEFTDGSAVTLSEKGIACKGAEKGFDVTWSRSVQPEGV